MRAEQIIQDAFQILKARGGQYGDGERERTMDKIVALFNQVMNRRCSACGFAGNGLGTGEGWLFMICLKLARIANETTPQLDSFIDAINYIALLGEEILPIIEESKS